MFENTQEYRWWLERTRISPGTFPSYRYRLFIFFRYLAEELGVDEEKFSIEQFYEDEETGRTYPMDRHLIRDFLAWLATEYEDRPATPQLCYAALQNFFHTLHMNGLIRLDPTVGVKGPVSHIGRRSVSLTDKEVQRLLDRALHVEPFSRRYLALILVLVHAGLRNKELRYLTADKIDFRQSHIVVDEGQKTFPGTVQMSPLLAKTLQHYLRYEQLHRDGWSDGSQYVFVSTRLKQLQAGTLVQIIAQLALEAGITKHVTPHVLRHTCGTGMARGGVHPSVIRDHLRHKNTNTTLRYTHSTIEEQRMTLDNSVMNRTIGRFLS